MIVEVERDAGLPTGDIAFHTVVVGLHAVPAVAARVTVRVFGSATTGFHFPMRRELPFPFIAEAPKPGAAVRIPVSPLSHTALALKSIQRPRETIRIAPHARAWVLVITSNTTTMAHCGMGVRRWAELEIALGYTIIIGVGHLGPYG